MRICIFCCIILFCMACSTSKNANTHTSNFNGTWIPVQEEISGKQLPGSVFINQKLIMQDSNYTVMAESIDKGIIRIKDNKMDIYGKVGVNSGKHFTAIYKLSNEYLTICYNLKGDSYPQGFETANKPLFFLSVFKKDLSKK